MSFTKIERPWGWYINMDGDQEITDSQVPVINHGYKVKRIGVYPGKRLSLQSHEKRSEHWVIIKGRAIVQVGQDLLHLEPNHHVYIPKGILHRLTNEGEEMVELIETQIGDYLGEDDIKRYEDDFGRV